LLQLHEINFFRLVAKSKTLETIHKVEEIIFSDSCFHWLTTLESEKSNPYIFDNWS
jgi:hypothetical protein